MSLSSIIKETAARYAVDDIYIAAIVLTESSLDQFAFRYEKNFFYKYIWKRDKKKLGGYFPENQIDEAEERNYRACSFGYMQIMGQVAREQGFSLPLKQLWCENINIEQGTRKFAKCILLAKKQQPNIKGLELIKSALLKYNGGGDLNYPNKVLKYVENGQARQVLDL